MIARRLRIPQMGWLLLPPAVAALAMTACSSSNDESPLPVPESDAGQTATEPDGSSTPETDGGIDSGEVEVETPAYDFEVKCTALPCVTRLAARGGSHACAIVQGGSVRCWGANASGQVGKAGDDAGPMPVFVGAPTEVVGISDAVALSASGDSDRGTSCVVSGSGTVSCFGSDVSGQLGRGEAPSSTPRPEPVELADVRAKSVTLTGAFAFAIGTDDRLWSWGSNDGYQLARPTAADAGVASAPGRAESITFAPRSCAGTSTTSFVVSANGELLSWGGSTLETLGRLSSLTRDPVPTAIALAEVSRVAAGASHACALRRAQVHCWGKNEHGQLGSGTMADQPLPLRAVLPSGVLAVDVAAGGDTTCIIASSGDVYCWGANDGGQVGGAAGVDQPSARRVDGLTEAAVALGVMDGSVCALLRSGAVTCWGDNLLGQLGRGARDVELHAPGPVVFQ